jgi:dihydrofolate synthase/folylpolyglutamate synthase
MFTSPHLLHLGERVQVDRRILTEAGICSYLEQLRPAAAALGREDPELHPTFFEFITAMAFLRFAAERVNLAMIETGLGGRLDATNVVEPELSIITSISFDHMEQLGDTLAKIAGEKAGIIKPGKPVLIGCLPGEAEAVIRATAAERGCACYAVRERFGAEALPETNLAGGFQRWNAALAVYATELLADRFPVHDTRALKEVDWAGRWQRMQVGGRTVILDATHNPEGCRALQANLEQLVAETGEKPVLVAGTLGEARGRSLMTAVAPFARELYLVEPHQDRAIEPAVLENFLPGERDFSVHRAELGDLFQRGGAVRVGRPGDIVVVTGSIYLIGEVLEQLQEGARGDGVNLQDRLP